MKKKLTIAFLSLMFMFTAVLTVACKKDPEKPDETPADYTAAVIVMNNVSEKLQDVSDKMANALNGQTSGNSGQLGAPVQGYEKNTDPSQYLYANRECFQYMYAIEYVTKNTIGSNYANTFEYGKVYSGPLNFDGFDGYAFIKVDAVEDGVNVFITFDTYQSGQDINVNINTKVVYDFESDVVKSLNMSFAMFPFVNDFWQVDYNFESNNFQYLRVCTQDYIVDNDPEAFTQAYNNGNFNYDVVMAQGSKYYIESMINGNIATSVDNVNFDAYSYTGDSLEETESISLKYVYNQMYNNMRQKGPVICDTSFIDKDNAIPATYLQDAVTYGSNKADYDKFIDGQTDKTYYRFSFIDAAEMINILDSLKTKLASDTTADDFHKEMVESSIGYVTGRGNTFVGSLGNFGGNALTLHRLSGINFTDNSTDFYTQFTIFNGNFKYAVVFDVHDGEITATKCYKMTYKFVYDLCIDDLEMIVNGSNPNYTDENHVNFASEVKSYLESRKNDEIILSNYEIAYDEDSNFCLYIQNPNFTGSEKYGISFCLETDYASSFYGRVWD